MQEASWPRHTSFTLIFDFIMQFDMVSSQQPAIFYTTFSSDGGKVAEFDGNYIMKLDSRSLRRCSTSRTSCNWK